MISLRWRLNYMTRPSRVGDWNDMDPKKSKMAAYAPKDGIIEAIIEAKLPDGTIKTMGGCPGDEWEAFQVLSTASIPGFFKGTINPIHSFAGLVLYTDDQKAFFLVSGKAWKEVREDKNISFEGWRN